MLQCSSFENDFRIKIRNIFNCKTLNNSLKYYTKKQFQGDYYIGGKVDGLYIDLDPTKSYVVEVKNRTKGFFNSLRDYESVQIQLYMWLLNLNQAKLVESYNNTLRITVIYKDNTFISDTLEYLTIFVINFEKDFLENKLNKELYINKNQNDKNVFLNKLYLSEIQTIKNEKYTQRVEETEDICLIDDLD